MSTIFYPRRTKREIDYSNDVLQALIYCAKSGFTQTQTSAYLNRNGLRSYSGLSFTAEIVKQTLKQLRLPRYRGNLYAALLRLIIAGEISISDSLFLITPRGLSTC